MYTPSEYEEPDKWTPKDIVITVSIIVFGGFLFFWAIITILEWFMGYPRPDSLLDVLKSQWEFIKDLRIW